MRVIKSFWLKREGPEILRLPSDAKVVHLGGITADRPGRREAWVLLDAEIPESAYLERTFIVIPDDDANGQTLIPAGAQYVLTVEPAPGRVVHLFESR